MSDAWVSISLSDDHGPAFPIYLFFHFAEAGAFVGLRAKLVDLSFRSSGLAIVTLFSRVVSPHHRCCNLFRLNNCAFDHQRAVRCQ